ncbi:unnamed protein product [Paramecium sonneborni]|uniref:Uncharacterized protein n=1 Tax=Paramecium sonneborni TaxID=65129 RepID=A0A8S1RNY1_9CILI|nr:unnamed protein product [Paramecium sonneborni]
MKLIIFTTICVKLKNNYKLQHRDYYLYKIFKKKAEKVKILILGVGAVGKSSFLNRYVDEKFSENIQATLGVEYRSENINIRTIKSLFKFGIQQVMKDLELLLLYFIEIIRSVFSLQCC